MFPRLEGINFCPLLKAHVLSTKMAITDNVRVRKCHWLHIIRSVFHMTLKKGDNRKNERMKKNPIFPTKFPPKYYGIFTIQSSYNYKITY